MQWITEAFSITKTGSDVRKQEFDALVRIDEESWKSELTAHKQWFDKLQDRLPKQFMLKRELFELALSM